VKLLIDMNLSPEFVAVFVREGWQAVHWASVGSPAASDREVMEWASGHGHVVVSHDLDFGALLASTGGRSPSVVQVRTQNVAPDSLGPLLVSTIRAHASALDAGAIVVVHEKLGRVRLLPL